ncbi:MAG: ribbon-helix-helix protein, CopG family [Candidatus Baldrarchaeia archaeon]
MPKVHIGIRIDVEKLKSIEQMAKKEGKTMSAFIRDILEEYIRRREDDFFETIPVIVEVYDKMLENLLNTGKLPLDEALSMLYNYFVWKYGKSPADMELDEVLSELRHLLTHFCKLELWSIKKYGDRIMIRIKTVSVRQTIWALKIVKAFVERFSKYTVKVEDKNRRDVIIFLRPRSSRGSKLIYPN